MSEQVRRKSELRKRYETEWGETAPEGDSDRPPFIPWLEGKLEQWEAEARDTNDPQVRPMTKMEHSLMDAQAEIGQLEAKLQLCLELTQHGIVFAQEDSPTDILKHNYEKLGLSSALVVNNKYGKHSAFGYMGREW